MAKYTARELGEPTLNNVKGRWLPARPENYLFDGWRLRLKLAWYVLLGKYDAVDWES